MKKGARAIVTKRYFGFAQHYFEIGAIVTYTGRFESMSGNRQFENDRGERYWLKEGEYKTEERGKCTKLD